MYVDIRECMSMLFQAINYETKRGRSYKITFSVMGYLLIHIVFIHYQSKFN